MVRYILSMLVAVQAAAGAWGAEAAGKDLAAPGKGWQSLLKKDRLDGWDKIQFGGEGEVRVSEGILTLDMGNPFTGVVWTNPVVRSNYEIELEARRDRGGDFFCGLTVPVKDSHCSLIVGGWGGGVIGISSIDSFDASENETTQYRQLERGRWYLIRFRVTDDRLQMWLDEEQMIDADIRDRRISLRPGSIDLCTPLGIASWQTAASIRNIRLRRLSAPPSPAPAPAAKAND